MYIPPAFAVKDLPTLQTFMETYSFATFVSAGETPFVTHLPLLIDRASNTLQGHFARANPHWKLVDGTRRATAVFHGPHAYISPTWYDGTKPAVPTWNYAAVHAAGIPVLREDAAWTKEFLERLVSKYESGRPNPWNYSLPSTFIDAMLTQIVAFEMPIETLEGKYKLNQNRSEKDRFGVIAGLDAEGGVDVAALMRQSLHVCE